MLPGPGVAGPLALQRKVILQAGLEAADHGRALDDQLEQAALRAIEAAGVEIVVDPDVAAFRGRDLLQWPAPAPPGGMTSAGGR